MMEEVTADSKIPFLELGSQMLQNNFFMVKHPPPPPQQHVDVVNHLEFGALKNSTASHVHLCQVPVSTQHPRTHVRGRARGHGKGAVSSGHLQWNRRGL